MKSDSVKIAFGCDSILNDYKVLKGTYKRTRLDVTVTRMQVYTTDADSWRQFQARIPTHWKNYRQNNVVVNGSVAMVFEVGPEIELWTLEDFLSEDSRSLKFSFTLQ
ncbi:hypothetical protein POM88_008790 [Heracleum sosnowskyi]|uniref:F-box associated beta-propeller type 3 domain-containing protein n=1 Tax=Heracleum sosnowskyi TaxID=360622 RepID=A0AAD8N7L4_9APIA|nr:hypothetical protein POM88_008790 [Heracleum sosnowskyi]